MQKVESDVLETLYLELRENSNKLMLLRNEKKNLVESIKIRQKYHKELNEAIETLEKKWKK